MLKQVTGHFGPGSFRPGVVSALSCFGLGRFGLGRFGPGSFRPSLVGRFGLFLAHLSRSLIVELIVYEGIRRPSVRLSTFSNDISSEAVRPILFVFHI